MNRVCQYINVAYVFLTKMVACFIIGCAIGFVIGYIN